MYWSDTKPILPEASGSSYELKEKDVEITTSVGEEGIDSCGTACGSFIGASVSEPHTSVTSLRSACVCLLACLSSCKYRKF